MAKGKYLEWITEEGTLLIEGWARDGLTDEQIAHNMGIAYSTLKVWKDKYPAISAALKSGKEVIDRKIENAMVKKALGYDYVETTFMTVTLEQEDYDLLVDTEMAIWDQHHPNATAEERYKFISSIPRSQEIVSKRVTKHVSPDTTAQIFWLKNRKPGQWRDKQELHHNGGLDIRQQYQQMSDEELMKIASQFNVQE